MNVAVTSGVRHISDMRVCVQSFYLHGIFLTNPFQYRSGHVVSITWQVGRCDLPRSALLADHPTRQA